MRLKAFHKYINHLIKWFLISSYVEESYEKKNSEEKWCHLLLPLDYQQIRGLAVVSECLLHVFPFQCLILIVWTLLSSAIIFEEHPLKVKFTILSFGASCLSSNQLQLCQHSYPQVMWSFCCFFLCRDGASELTYLTSINKIDKKSNFFSIFQDFLMRWLKTPNSFLWVRRILDMVHL